MRSCKETATLLTKANYSTISRLEWLAVHIHLLMCRLCRDHQRQSKILDKASRRLIKGKKKVLQLSNLARQRIRQALLTVQDKR